MYRVLSWIQGVLIPQLGPLGLVAVAFLDSSFLSLPEINDILVVSAALANPATAWLPITLTTLGSVTGCSVLWFMGRRGGEALLERRFGRERTARTREAYRRWGILALAVPALFPPPVPFKIFVLMAGVAEILSEAQCSIIDINQTVVQGKFAMVIIANAAPAQLSVADLKNRLRSEGEKLGVHIYAQREDLFNAMHRI